LGAIKSKANWTMEPTSLLHRQAGLAPLPPPVAVHRGLLLGPLLSPLQRARCPNPTAHLPCSGGPSRDGGAARTVGTAALGRQAAGASRELWRECGGVLVRDCVRLHACLRACIPTCPRTLLLHLIPLSPRTPCATPHHPRAAQSKHVKSVSAEEAESMYMALCERTNEQHVMLIIYTPTCQQCKAMEDEVGCAFPSALIRVRGVHQWRLHRAGQISGQASAWGAALRLPPSSGHQVCSFPPSTNSPPNS